MFRIHAIDFSNRDDYCEALEQQFRIRHEIYVRERRWTALDRPDGREIDPFDTPDAIYLLGLTEAGWVVAGSRLLPTLRPHLMSEVFPALAAEGVPRAPDILEWTRFFVIPALREPGRPCRAAGIVLCGILEFCLERRIRALTVVCESFWIERLARLGWAPRKLGPTLMHGGEKIAGLALTISPAALTATRQAYAIPAPVLWRPSRGGGRAIGTGAPARQEDLVP